MDRMRGVSCHSLLGYAILSSIMSIPTPVLSTPVSLHAPSHIHRVRLGPARLKDVQVCKRASCGNREWARRARAGRAGDLRWRSDTVHLWFKQVYLFTCQTTFDACGHRRDWVEDPASRHVQSLISPESLPTALRTFLRR